MDFIKILFMGAADFAVPVLTELQSSKYDLVGIFTQPDRPRGRGKKVQFSRLKQVALGMNVPIYQPESIKSPEVLEILTSLQPDVIIVVAYGQIIPKTILNFPPFGCINLHASLLPAYRGAAPIERAIMAGESVTGISIMQMSEGLDEGPVFAQKTIPINSGVDGGELRSSMAETGAKFLLEVLPEIFSGKLQAVAQVEHRASYAHKLVRADEMIDWNQEAFKIHNIIRALSPKPGAYTRWEGKRLKILKTSVCEEIYPGVPGEIIIIDKDFLIVKCAQASLKVYRVMLEGKKALNVAEFLRGSPISLGTVLGVQED